MVQQFREEPDQIVLISLPKETFIQMMEDAIRRVMTEYIASFSNTPNQNALLTRREAASEFNISVATLDNYKRRGLIVPLRLGALVRFRRGDLVAAFSRNVPSAKKRGS